MTSFCALCQQPLPDAPQLSIVASVDAPIDPSRKSRAADPDSAKTAARLAVVRAGTQRWKLLDAIAAAGPSGLTSEQASERCRLIYVAGSTRCSELLRGGLVERTGHTRPTSSGVSADVLVATQAGRDALREKAAAA